MPQMSGELIIGSINRQINVLPVLLMSSHKALYQNVFIMLEHDDDSSNIKKKKDESYIPQNQRNLIVKCMLFREELETWSSDS